jgi:hypothetical protein
MTVIDNNRQPAPAVANPRTPGHFNFAAAVCLLALAGVFVVKALAAWREYPESFVDEVIYMEPAWQAATTGSFANPGIALQLAGKGVPGLNHGSFLNLPATLWIKTPLLEIMGASLRGLRLVDLVIVCAAAAAFAYAAKRLAHAWRWLLAVSVFILNPIFIWAPPGRPDLLSLLFGLTALGLILRSRRDPPSELGAGTLLTIGALLGCCASCHLFGGVYWTVTATAVLLAGEDRFRQAPRALFLLGVGTALPLAANAAWLVHGGAEAWRQFHWLLDLKRGLHRSFGGTLTSALIQSLGRNPLILVFLVFLPWAVIGRQRRLLAAWSLALVTLLVWRCAAFEGYNHAYEVHLWASLCCLFALALEGMCRSTNRAAAWLTRSTAGSGLLAISLVLAGFGTGYNKWIEATALNYARQHRKIQQVVAQSIPPGARVLASCDAYFLVKQTNVLAMSHHDKLDLAAFDYIVTRTPLVSLSNRDQWFDVLTPAQNVTFQTSFRLVAELPAVTLGPPPFRGAYQPKITGLCVYRRSTAGFQSSQKPGPLD